MLDAEYVPSQPLESAQEHGGAGQRKRADRADRQRLNTRAQRRPVPPAPGRTPGNEGSSESEISNSVDEETERKEQPRTVNSPLSSSLSAPSWSPGIGNALGQNGSKTSRRLGWDPSTGTLPADRHSQLSRCCWLSSRGLC